jgi:hypothetical protein
MAAVLTNGKGFYRSARLCSGMPPAWLETPAAVGQRTRAGLRAARQWHPRAVDPHEGTHPRTTDAMIEMRVGARPLHFAGGFLPPRHAFRRGIGGHDSRRRVRRIWRDANAPILAGAISMARVWCLSRIATRLAHCRRRTWPVCRSFPSSSRRAANSWNAETELVRLRRQRPSAGTFRPRRLGHVLPVNRLGAFVGETVTVCGLIVEQRTHHQITGEPMKFLTLADWTGMIETELFARPTKRMVWRPCGIRCWKLKRGSNHSRTAAGSACGRWRPGTRDKRIKRTRRQAKGIFAFSGGSDYIGKRHEGGKLKAL